MGWDPISAVKDVVNKHVDVFTGGAVTDISDITGSKAAAEAAEEANRKAMASEERMFNQSMDFQKEMWDWQKTEMEPWKEAGLSNLGKYQTELDAGYQYKEDPGYQFRLSEGEKGINRAASAGGRYLSGGTLRELGRFNSNQASQEYGAGYGRYQDRLSRLGQLSQLGYSASTNLGNIGSQHTQQGSQTMTNFGASQAQGYMNQGAIQAQAATAPFQNLMYGAMTYGPRG